MKTKRKALTLAFCAMILVGATFLGTLAYLTDSEAVTNTFTVGKVGLDLDEAKVNEDGTVVEGADRVKANTYHLLPGHTYTKDPTIHVDDDSEDCYLFVKVDNQIAGIEADETIADQMAAIGWKPVADVANVYVFAKEEKFDKYAVSKCADVVVFERFTIDGATVDNDTIAEYKDSTIIVTAYAVQKDGFEGKAPEQIWEATFGAPQGN